MKYIKLAAVVMIAIVALAACAPALAPTAVPSTQAPVIYPTVPVQAPTSAAPAKPAQAPTVAALAKTTALIVTKTTLGSILADGDGRVLYIYTKDTPNTSNCYDNCAVNWPPFLSSAKSDALAGVNAAMIGTTTRKDGTTQITYNGWPLYYWAKDKNPGDTLGQGVGSVWWVIKPDGIAITPAAESSSSSSGYNY